MGNGCTSCASINSCASHVRSIRQVGSIDELTFTDIDAAWKIALHEAAKLKHSKNATVVQRTGWITVRVFVSSTFKDFDAEREILVKNVFPDLREWCQSRRLHLVECDLRWGVPLDSTTEATLRTCLGEIDRCYAENIMPFFVNMTSERVGWIPLGNQLPVNLKHEYRWIDGLSVTEMEILHGAYRIDNPNALFMIRDSSFLQSVPEEHRHYFIDECSLAPYKLEQLKKNLRVKFATQSQVTSYTCEFAGLDKDTKMPRFKGLTEHFAPTVLNFFKQRIAIQYPLVDEKKQEPLEEAKTQHDSFMKMASDRVVGRDVLIDELVDLYIMETKNAPVVIYGGPGLGKTSIMAALTDRCISMTLMQKLPTPAKDSRWRVFSHFVGAVAGSTDLLSMLNRLLVETETLREGHKRPISVDEAMGLVRSALSNPKTKNTIIIVDAINQFDDHRGMPAPISWLPLKMSPTVRIIVSLTPESSQYKSVRDSGEGWTFLQLQPLDRETKERMVTSQLGRYNKQLDQGQLELLLNKRSSNNPMWLSLATEELRVFGRFRELTNKIGALPDGLAELEADILGRFEQESDGKRLIATLCLLECSVHGLLESELFEMLAHPKLLPPSLNEKIAAVKTYSLDGYNSEMQHAHVISTIFLHRLTARQWADIYRVLRPFMRPFGASGEGRLDFYHRSLSKAVRNRYYFKTVKTEKGETEQEKQEDVIKWFHKLLAEYFGAKCKHLERRVEEYPIHAYKCGDVEGLKDFLCNWDIFDLMYDPEFSRQLNRSWEHVYFLTHKKEDGDSEEKDENVFGIMEQCYLAKLDKELADYQNLPPDKQKTIIRHMDCVARVLAQNGRFASAFGLSERLISLAYPDVEKWYLGFDNPTLFSNRQFEKVGEELADEDRLQFARYLHLAASVYDEEMRQVDYMYQSHIPKIIIIIELLETVIAILRKLAPDDMLIGRSLNRCSFFYSALEMRGGCSIVPRQECTPRAIKLIDDAIEFYSAKDHQELNKADCYITRGVVAENGKKEQVESYIKGLNLILENAGQCHPLLDRCYLNMGIYYEETREVRLAYNYFRKWYELLHDLYGGNHPRTNRAVRTLNENTYFRMAKSVGHTVPQIGVEEDKDGDDGEQQEQQKQGNNPIPNEEEQKNDLLRSDYDSSTNEELD